MFGISLPEILVIFAVSLIFFKPAEIISFASKIYEFFQKIKLEAEIIKNDILLKEIRETKDEIYKDFIENEFTLPEKPSKQEEDLK